MESRGEEEMSGNNEIRLSERGVRLCVVDRHDGKANRHNAKRLHCENS